MKAKLNRVELVTIPGDTGENHPDVDMVKPLLVPLVIIGGKYDAFQGRYYSRVPNRRAGF